MSQRKRKQSKQNMDPNIEKLILSYVSHPCADALQLEETRAGALGPINPRWNYISTRHYRNVWAVPPWYELLFWLECNWHSRDALKHWVWTQVQRIP